MVLAAGAALTLAVILPAMQYWPLCVSTKPPRTGTSPIEALLLADQIATDGNRLRSLTAFWVETMRVGDKIAEAASPG